MNRYLLRLRGTPANYQPSAKWEGSPAGIGPEGNKARESTWLKVARWLIAQGFDPDVYIRRQFDRYQGIEPPLPNQLLSSRCQSNYHRDGDEAETEIRIEFCFEKTRFELEVAQRVELAGLDRETAVAQVLLDIDLPLSPLFRYCVGRKVGGEKFNEIADMFKSDAMIDYMRHREEHEAVWGDWIPRDFAREAPAAYRKHYS